MHAPAISGTAGTGHGYSVQQHLRRKIDIHVVMAVQQVHDMGTVIVDFLI